jgi:hypothetical protein
VRYRRWEGNATTQGFKMTESIVRVLEKNLKATRRPELRPLYQRSFNLAKGRLELARAVQIENIPPSKMAGVIWRAWRIYPRRTKWLYWFVLLKWPTLLGGDAIEATIHRKLVQNFS